MLWMHLNIWYILFVTGRSGGTLLLIFLTLWLLPSHMPYDISLFVAQIFIRRRNISFAATQTLRKTTYRKNISSRRLVKIGKDHHMPHVLQAVTYSQSIHFMKFVPCMDNCFLCKLLFENGRNLFPCCSELIFRGVQFIYVNYYVSSESKGA